MVTDPSSGRAQLILVGALTVALLVVGVTITLNTVLFVENTPTNEGTVFVDVATQVDEETRDAAVSTVLHVNHQTRNHSDFNELTTYVDSNITALESSLRRQYLSARSLTVNVTVKNPSQGTRVVQSKDANFTASSFPSENAHKCSGASTAAECWEVAETGSHRIGWLLVNLNASEVRTGPFHVNASNGSESVNVTVERTSGSTYQVTSNVSTGGNTSVTCATHGGRLVLDLRNGESSSDRDCRFNGTSEIPDASQIHFENAKQAYGRYSIVFNESASELGGPFYNSNNQCGATPPPMFLPPSPTDPCHTPAVWSLQVETEVVGSAFTHSNLYNTTVYAEGEPA